MLTFLLIIHLLIALALIGVILLQRSEGGGLVGGGGGGLDQFASSRSTANFLTRTTAVLAGLFIASSLLLTLSVGDRRSKPSIIDEPVVDMVPVPPLESPDIEPSVRIVPPDGDAPLDAAPSTGE